MAPVVESFEMKNAEMPANDICASEIWPTKPVITTIDRQMMTPTSVFDSAPRYSGLKKSRPAAAAMTASAGPP